MSVIVLPLWTARPEARAFNYHELEKARERLGKNLPGLPAAQAARKAGPIIRIGVAKGALMRASITESDGKIKSEDALPQDTKSNEITAIPELLDMLALKCAIVTIDAMGTQSETAARIIDRQADYVLALKGNQSSLHDDVGLFFADDELRRACQSHAETDLGHGRIEERRCLVRGDIEWLRQRHPHWQGLRSIIKLTATRTDKKSRRQSTETRFYISSLEPRPDVILNAVTAHWRIENNLHWQLDVTFNEDASRMRKDNTALSFAIMRRFAFNMLKRETSIAKDLVALGLAIPDAAMVDRRFGAFLAGAGGLDQIADSEYLPIVDLLDQAWLGFPKSDKLKPRPIDDRPRRP